MEIAIMVAQILYQKVADDIKKNILSGTYEVGALIPTESELEKSYEVSKITVRKAVELLVAEGYLKKKSGIGTRVISNNLFNKLSKARSYSSIVNEQGNLTKKVLEVKNMNSNDTPLRNLFKNRNITFIRRLYSFDDKPFIIVKHYLPDISIDEDTTKLEYQSLYKFMKDNGQEPYSFKDSFSAVNLDESEKDILQKDDTLALQRVRKGYNTNGNLIEYTISTYDSEQLPYEIEYEI